MKIINNLLKDIREITNAEELLNSPAYLVDRALIMYELQNIFTNQLLTFEEDEDRKITIHLKDTIINTVFDTYRNIEISEMTLDNHKNFKRDFQLSTGFHIVTSFNTKKNELYINLDKDYYMDKYNIKNIEIANQMSDEYFKYQYGDYPEEHPVMIREYSKRAKEVIDIVNGFKERLNMDNRFIMNIILLKRDIMETCMNKENNLLFNINYYVVDGGTIRVAIKPTWQFKKMNRKLNKPYKPPVHFNDGVCIKFVDCTPLISKKFMLIIRKIVTKFNNEHTEKWVIKKEYLKLIGKLFKVVEYENSKEPKNNLYIKYELDLRDLNMLIIRARYFTPTGLEICIDDKCYQEIYDYKMYESPTLSGLLRRNRKGDYEDAMYMIKRYNRTHNIPYKLDKGLLVPERPENDLDETYARDVVSQFIGFMCADVSSIIEYKKPNVKDMDIEFDSSSWRYELPRIIITLK